MFRTTGNINTEYCRHYLNIVTSWLRNFVGVTDIVRLQRTNVEARRSRIVSLCCVGVQGIPRCGEQEHVEWYCAFQTSTLIVFSMVRTDSQFCFASCPTMFAVRSLCSTCSLFVTQHSRVVTFLSAREAFFIVLLFPITRGICSYALGVHVSTGCLPQLVLQHFLWNRSNFHLS